MLFRVTSILLATVLCLAVLPFGSAALVKPKAGTVSQESPLQLSQTKVDLPNGGRMLTLTGQYQIGARRVNLRSTVLATNPVQVLGPPPIEGRPDSAAQEEYRPEEDHYYSYSEMSRSEGTPLVQATYEFEASTDRSMLYITISGVTLSFNLNTEELGPVTDEDLERLNQWLTSDDGRLVQDTSVAIIQQGPQQGDPEPLKNYYAIAMLVDNNPPAETALKINNKRRVLAHHPVRTLASLNTPTNDMTRKSCQVPISFSAASSSADSSGLLRLICSTPQGNCFGWCGWGCFGIMSRSGYIISGGPCSTHDSCTRANGNRPFAQPCLRSFAAAVIYVLRRW